MITRKTCPACGGKLLDTLYHVEAIPAQSVVLLDTREEALNYPTGELSLTLCRSCGLLFNATFDASLVDYAATTEESQHFSDTFNRFARNLVLEIASRQQLNNALTLEVGCGKGDLLAELVRETATRAIGVDPGFIPDRFAGDLGDRIRFIRDYFDPSKIEDIPDLVICRHTLEHIDEVGEFANDIVAVTNGQPSVQVMFETPDVDRVLAEGAFWDIYHEHCSYFTIGSHARLLRRAGLNVSHSRLAYQGQYIIQYASPGTGNPLPEEDDLDRILMLSDAFPGHVAKARDNWIKRVRDTHESGKRVAIWGGGSKAVSFLTTNKLGPEIDHVIDINVHKQGKHMPGTGHIVSAPEVLQRCPPDLVIVMNPVYLSEVRSALVEMDLHPEVVAV